MKIPLRRALELAVGPANVDAAGHAVADWFDSIDRNATANRVREALRDQPDQPAPAVPHSQPDTSLRAELLQKLATHREVLLNLCDRVDRLEMRADGLTPIERVERHWAKERSVKESLTVGGDRLAVPEDREPVALVGEPTDAELGSLWAGAAHIDQEHGGVKFARAVLARWGHQPAPPAEGEAAEVAAWLRAYSDEEFGPHNEDPDIRWFARAAELLQQRHAEAVPGPSDTRYEFSVCDTNYNEHASGSAPTYAQALSEGRHYLARLQQDGPHTLELCRVEVLNPDALPLPAGEVQP